MDAFEMWYKDAFGRYGNYMAPIMLEHARQAWEAAIERCAKLCEDWSAGAGVVNACEGCPTDPRQDIETAGDQLAYAIRELAGAVPTSSPNETPK